MIILSLIFTYLGCLSAGAMLSMLLLLVGAYIGASVWLLNQGVLYTGLLYILVYVGAIVVLIMFVVQLTNTSLSGDSSTISTPLLLIQNSVLIILISLLIGVAYSILGNEILINLTNLNLTDNVGINNNLSINDLVSNLNTLISKTSLSILAFTIFNEYGYILILSVHAILLAIMGPIKLAVSDLSSSVTYE